MHSALPHKLHEKILFACWREHGSWDGISNRIIQTYTNCHWRGKGDTIRIQNLCNESNWVKTQIIDKLCLIFRRFYTHLSIYWERLKLIRTVQWNNDGAMRLCVRWWGHYTNNNTRSHRRLRYIAEVFHCWPWSELRSSILQPHILWLIRAVPCFWLEVHI